MTKHTLTPDSITAAKALVSRLCENGHIRMSVPVDFARDEDMLICALIDAAEKSLDTPPAASGAAPALPTPWKTVMDATGEPVQVWRAFQMRDYARDVLALATPVQVAPPPTDDQMREALWFAMDMTNVIGRTRANLIEYFLHKVNKDRLAAPVAPQDDARDAAEVLTDEQLDAIAVERYTVVPNPDKVFGYAVHAGNGRGACYRGHRTECESVAARMRTAFLDGAYVARHPESVLSTPAAKPTEPALPTLPTQGDAKGNSLDAQIKSAQAEVAGWSPEKRRSMRLQGFNPTQGEQSHD